MTGLHFHLSYQNGITHSWDLGDQKIQVGTDLRIGKKESSRRLTFLFLYFDHFYHIAWSKASIMKCMMSSKEKKPVPGSKR